MAARITVAARDYAASDYLAARGMYGDAHPDSITYELGFAQCARYSPLGTVVLVFAPDAASSTVIAHVAAARQAGNSVKIALAEPVSTSLAVLCDGIEFVAGAPYVHRMLDSDDKWQSDSPPNVVAVFTDDVVAIGTKVHASEATTGADRSQLVRFYSSRTDITIPIEVVAISRTISVTKAAASSTNSNRKVAVRVTA